ncbi:hypothetical protein, partial [Bacillus toyonensis]|uniref:hypothetical protein n=1 Tax=Bacillus toyonensis TaxID=155322 RepID=UPI001C54D0A1
LTTLPTIAWFSQLRKAWGDRTLKILRLQRFSATNLISSVFEEQSVQVYGSKYVGLCQSTFISHLKLVFHIFTFLKKEFSVGKR